uniref:Saposin B-type domain-containing protein n=1 Tax=Trichobilharzia regenti TaxID=157069 RepID=A0AA85KBI9_TRIRE|nr:unnamed protein product [Trichobilharzia regenti]
MTKVHLKENVNTESFLPGVDKHPFDTNTTCTLCIDTLYLWQKVVSSTDMRKYLDSYAKFFCSFSIIYKDQCEVMVEQYFDTFIHIVDHTNYVDLCKATPLCKA